VVAVVQSNYSFHQLLGYRLGMAIDDKKFVPGGARR